MSESKKSKNGLWHLPRSLFRIAFKTKRRALLTVGFSSAAILGLSNLGEAPAALAPPATEAPAGNGRNGGDPVDTPKEVAGPAFDAKAGKQNMKNSHNVGCTANVSRAGGNIIIRTAIDGAPYAGDWAAYTIKSKAGNITAWSANPGEIVVKDPGGVAAGKSARLDVRYQFPFGNKTSFVICETGGLLSMGELGGIQPGTAPALSEVAVAMSGLHAEVAAATAAPANQQP